MSVCNSLDDLLEIGITCLRKLSTGLDHDHEVYVHLIKVTIIAVVIRILALHEI